MISNESKYEYLYKNYLSHGFVGNCVMRSVVKIFGCEPLLRMIFVVLNF